VSQVADWRGDLLLRDSNGDDIGDFVGLTAKLDYLEDLGVNGPLAAAVLSVAGP
jgi:hypothetical protein